MIHGLSLLGGKGRKPDRDTIRRLYEEHGNGLIAYASSILNSFASGEDVVHQLFVRLLRSGMELREPVAPYLYRSVRNACRNYVRDRSREVDLHDDWFNSATGSHESVVLLQSALREIPEEQRETVVMRIWGQLTFDEIGSALQISSKTAVSRYRYGLAKLREQFNPAAKG
jgi:RNA polymerase sigma-70 factor (ECF subfamily)